ncbi:hypothetical protein EOA85_01025 [Mesorhizobium sp. M5C.F.Ca.IN.020.29.1.1]|uniref:anhydro-N-acetylmuramic acid kinase n=2 Tax=Mesorhizobium sp. TaxID=1871066 RepID=UPI000FCA0F51|nr:hypothetical protein EOA85_01025 [Mesorhizobium sp. M5C.F.Ca.IN.020.29.1.1]TIM87104.1 MAG: hypothetical protein E5Y50_13305 [Mesorhizobium sp.]
MTCLSPDALSQVKISDASRSYLGQRTKPLLSYWWHATFITAAVWMLTSATTAGRLEASIQKQTAEPAAAHLRMGRKRAVAPPAIAEGQALAHARFHRFMESRSDGSLRSPTDIHKFAHATCGVVLQSLGRPYDKDGEVASKGKVDDMLMVRLKEHDFFKRPIPRSAWRLDFGSSCHERNRICGLRSRANPALMEDRRKDRLTARRPQLSGGEPPGERHG